MGLEEGPYKSSYKSEILLFGASNSVEDKLKWSAKLV